MSPLWQALLLLALPLVLIYIGLLVWNTKKDGR